MRSAYLRSLQRAALICALLVGCLETGFAALEDSFRALTEVGAEGRGNEAARAAWHDVVQAGPAVLPEVLAAAGRGSAVADNWLRLAGDALLDQARRTGQPLPLDAMESFLRDPHHASAGRQLAFDLIQAAAPERAEAIEPSLLHDPVQSLRRGAVQKLLQTAPENDPEARKTVYLTALNAVRDEDQTKTIARELRKLGAPVDLPSHFGFLMKWMVIGPFDNANRAGFDAVFPPEKEIRLDATYPGKTEPVKWQPFESKDDYGKIDFNKPLGMLKEATAYAVTQFDSTEERDAELRLGCKDAWKVWLNGQFLFGRDEYHRGQQLDQYKLRCHLRKGANTILVKCCQNEQKEDWTVEWEFQLRVCDAAGTAIASAQGASSAPAGSSSAP